MEFLEFKTEIIKRAKEANACSDEYKRAIKSNSFEELFKVIGDNFIWSCDNKVIDIPFLSKVEESILTENNFYINISTSKGFLMADSATVEASGSATVKAWGSATVEAWGSAYIDSRNNIEHKISDKVILRYYYDNKVVLADESSFKTLTK